MPKLDLRVLLMRAKEWYKHATPEQIEDLGVALMKLEQRMQVLKAEFGLSDQDLNLDLGPIGRLI